jgi:hypothetical protein
VHDHPGGLVDGDEVPVLVKDGERDGLRDERDRLGRRGREGHLVAGSQLPARPGRPPVHGDLALVDPALQLRAAEGERLGGEERIEAFVGVRRRDDEAVRYQIFDFRWPFDLISTSTMARS